MIKSMTGYGGAKGTSGKLEISVELRSVNNRYLDCSIRIPKVYTAFEDAIKSAVNSYISRGKVDVFVSIDASKADDAAISVNETTAGAYVEAIAKLSELYGVKNDLTAMSLARLPDVLTVEKKEADTDELQKDILSILDEALKAFDVMRTREGERLKTDLEEKLDEVERLTLMAEKRSPEVAGEYRKKLEQRMRDVLATADVDEARIVTEAALFADKIAVDEEMVRLKSHIAQFRQIIADGGIVGRKLDFLVQELNREANTTGSKGNDVTMARIVVDMKSEIEKIREQIQNIE